MNNIVYTIGYSGYPDQSYFMKALNSIRPDEKGLILIDVRSSPYSGYYEQYNKDKLESELKKVGIYYRNYASSFGARQTDHQYYTEGEDGYLDFEKFTQSSLFMDGFNKMIKSLEAGYIPVFMCAEKDPINCHRAIMVTRVFSEKGYVVNHIMPDSSKTQKELEEELLDKFFKEKMILEGQTDLFSTMSDPSLPPIAEYLPNRSEQIRQAYRKQNEKIGFKWKDIENGNLYDRFHKEKG